MPRSPQQIADYAAKMDKFAELLSLDLPIPVIADRMCIPSGSAYVLLGQLRAKYGWQSA